MTEFQARRKKHWLVQTVFTVVAASLIGWGIATGNLIVALVAAMAPLAALIIMESFAKKQFAFILLFVLNYFISLLPHYVYNFSEGILMDLMIAFNILVLFSNALIGNMSVKNINWKCVILISIWLGFCVLEVLNPRMISVNAWMSSLRNMALYFFMVFIIVQISTEKFQDLKDILFVLSILVFIATVKVVYQKYVGFTSGDKYFLDVLGGRTTHIIYYGTRYFSIFSDAANYGGSMGMCFVTYAIIGLHTPNKFLKIYWWVISLMALYGMFISGTRSALIIPVAGIMIYLGLIKDFKKMIPIAFAMGIVIFFLACTKIGDGNSTIRRARTVFHKNEDRSYVIRKENQAKLRKIMKSMPLGNSLGMSGGRGIKYGDRSAITEIPTDSWFVQLWVETGVVGQTIYFGMMLYLFIAGGLYVMFKCRHNEIKGYAAGMLAGVAGLFAMSSNNEVFSQFPNGIIVYTFFALTFLCPKFEQQMQIDNTDDQPQTTDLNNHS